jgi:hypothetical protein
MFPSGWRQLFRRALESGRRRARQRDRARPAVETLEGRLVPSFTAATGNTLSVTEGAAFSGAVATFTTPTPGDTFTANINWGDGTSSTGTVTGAASPFTVSGTHTYADEAVGLAVKVTITDTTDSTAATATGSATVAEGDTLTPINNSNPPAFAENTQQSGFTGRFSDSNTSATPGDFTATIDWGDGTTTTGVVPVGNTGGPFTVVGTHTFADEGVFTVTTVLSDDAPGTARATASFQVTVTEADTLAVASVQPPVSLTEGGTTGGALAVFNDTGYPTNSPSDFTATIDWGDGTTDTGTVSGGSGAFTVSGTHTYSDEGTFTVRVALADDAPGTASATATTTATVSEGDTLAAAATQPTVTAIETISFSDPVAAFTDTYTGQVAGDFTATIDWGDGTTTAGTVSGGSGLFTVSGTHTYAEEGSFSPVVVLTDDAPGTAKATATSTATVTEGSFVLSGTPPITATEGTAFSGVVATINDPGSPDPAGAYTATIDWGDGTTSAGTVTGTTGSGIFTISGTHTYADEMSGNISVTVSEGSFTIGPNPDGVTVVEGDTLVAAAVQPAVTATEGTAASGAVAVISDTGYPGNNAADFTASIDWGDGTTSAGTVSGSGGSFTVSGTHTYADEGTFTAAVTLTDASPGTATVTVSRNIVVAEGDTLSATATPVFATEGTALTGAVVATFTDTYTGSVAGDFTATILWGDGTTSAGTVTGAGGSFTVAGNHTYFDEGVFTPSVVVADDTPGTASATVSGTVNVAEADILTATAGAALTGTEGAAVSGALATFTNVGYPSNPGTDFTATVFWGDGTSSAGTVTPAGAGTFQVAGTHTYADEGVFAVSVVFADDAPGTASATATLSATVAEADVLATAAVQPTVTATEGASTGPVVLGAFTDAGYSGSTAADFTATIDWGDGTTSAGTVTGAPGGPFTVTGTHTYAEDGTYAPVVVLSDDAPGTARATATATAVVAEAVITGTVSFAPTEGGFSGAVATFTDPGSSDPAGNYAATISWGDGTTTAGTVTGSAGSYTVTGTHTYADEGPRNVAVTFTETGVVNGTTTASATVTVAEGDVLSGTASNLKVVRGEAFTRTVATFTNSGFPANPAADFTTTIDWGDGTNSAGTVAGGGGLFTVSGTHTYATAGPFTMTITLSDDQPGTASATAVATATGAGTVVVVPPVIAVGAVVNGSEVRVVDVDTGAAVRTLVPYGPDFKGGIDVALGDVTGDGVPDVVTAAGLGGAGHIKVYDGLTGAEVYSFFAYDPSFRGGAFVAVGDVNGDGRADIITGAGFGGAPNVKVFSGKDLSVLASFFAYDASFRNGVHVAAGDVNGDGRADVITGAGTGGAPHVKVFDVAHGLAVLQSFYAYAPNFFGGVFVGAGDGDGDGKADIITGAASGGSGHVVVFSGATGAELDSFFAFSPNARDGVTVAGVDPRQTGRALVATGQGAGSPGIVKLFDQLTLSETDVFSTLDQGFQDGVYVG